MRLPDLPLPRLRVLLPAAAVALALLTVLGRWEYEWATRAQNRQMAATFRLATREGLDSPLLDAYRLAEQFDCLLYRAHAYRHAYKYALELCFDPTGRLVETIDRRRSTDMIGSLRWEPSAATLRLSPRKLLSVFHAIGAFSAHQTTGNALPVDYNDTGPLEASRH